MATVTLNIPNPQAQLIQDALSDYAGLPSTLANAKLGLSKKLKEITRDYQDRLNRIADQASLDAIDQIVIT